MYSLSVTLALLALCQHCHSEMKSYSNTKDIARLKSIAEPTDEELDRLDFLHLTQITCYGDAKHLRPLKDPYPMAEYCSEEQKFFCNYRFETPLLMTSAPIWSVEGIYGLGKMRSELALFRMQSPQVLHYNYDDETYVATKSTRSTYSEWDFERKTSSFHVVPPVMFPDRGEAQVYYNEIDRKTVLGIYVPEQSVVISHYTAGIEQDDDIWKKPDFEYSTTIVGANQKVVPICSEFDIPDETHMELLLMTSGAFHYQPGNELCSHVMLHGDRDQNLGGMCFYPQGIEFEGKIGLLDLFASPMLTQDYYHEPTLAMNESLKTIRRLCHSHCRCPRRQKIRDREHALSKVFKIYGLNRLPYSNNIQAAVEGFCKGLMDPDGHCEATEKSEIGSSPFYIGDSQYSTCRTTECQGPRDCGGPTSGCRCQARQQLVDPSNFTPLKFIGLCGIAAVQSGRQRLKLGGRGLALSGGHCVCNSTYISAACCASADGLVWEPAQMKIGELAQQVELKKIKRATVQTTKKRRWKHLAL